VNQNEPTHDEPKNTYLLVLSEDIDQGLLGDNRP
jgi:hypothetical protein